MKKLTLLTILAAASLTACDTESETPSPSSKVQLLTAGPWHITSWTQTSNGGTPVNQMSAQACQRDDRYTFGTTGGGVMTRTEGPTACGSGNSQTVVSTSPWNFNSSQTVLNIGSASMGNTNIPYEVVRLTPDAMQLRYSRTSNGNALVDVVDYVN